MKITLAPHWSTLLLLAVAVTGFAVTPAVGQDELQTQEEDAIRAAVDTVAPSVLRIETFGGLEKVGRVLVGTGPTTDLVVSEDGYVLSSAFNFVQKPSSILVTMPDGKRSSATIVARDQSRMLVLLKVNANQKLVVPEFGSRKELLVGQWTFAVGRTFDRGAPNVSVGVLSAVNRVWGKAIQTDAKVSPGNYGGPLVNIRGQVIGLLVPLSPNGRGEMAGAEWYDSGIGFAIPLEGVLRHLDKLKAGEDLMPGVLGVTLKGSNIYSDSAEVAVSQPKSPAYEAGIRAGDKIVEVDEQKIVRQAQLRHALGDKYAGDKVHLVAIRGDGDSQERIEADVVLTDKLTPYEHPFLGILPKRHADGQGVVTRFVYPGSAADDSGIQAGDRIVQLDGKPVESAASLRDRIAAFEPEQTVPVQLQRDGKPVDIELKLGRLPSAEIPAQLPPARDASPEDVGQRPPVGVVKVEIPEEKNQCVAFVPDNYDPAVAYGLVVVLPPPGKFDESAFVQRWKDVCAKQDLIAVAPQPVNAARWSPTEADFVRKSIEDLRNDYTIDPSRVVVHGDGAGGAMAYLVAFGQRDLIRGAAIFDAAVPRRLTVPPNDPIQRLAIYTAVAEKSRQAAAVKAVAKRLGDLKYPITVQTVAGEKIENDSWQEMVRWIDTLDRI